MNYIIPFAREPNQPSAGPESLKLARSSESIERVCGYAEVAGGILTGKGCGLDHCSSSSNAR